jgi:putative membrane protein
MKYAMCVGTVVLAVSVAPAFAQQSTPPARPQTQPGSSTKGSTRQAEAKMSPDQHFVMEAAKGGMAEVELGKLAADRASSEDVKKFGQRMVDDHGKANDELKKLAENKNLTLPTAPDPKQKATVDRLSKLSGEAFDRAYMQEMLRDHRKDVSEFRTESKSGKDPDVKAWAAKTLPTLEEHLRLAQDANKAVGTSGTMNKKNPKSPKR